jgi:hypothetical protein
MIEGIHSFLVHPAKSEAEQPKIGGTAIAESGPLRSMLEKVFSREKWSGEFGQPDR